MNKGSILKHFDFLLVDVVTLTLSFIFSYLLYLGNFNQLINSSKYVSLYLIVLIISFSIYYFIEPYSGILKRSWKKEAKEVLLFEFYSSLVLSLYLLVSKQGADYSRIFIFLFYVIYGILGFICRIGLKRFIRNNAYSLFNKQSKNRILVVTSDKEAQKVSKNINKYNYGQFSIDSLCIINKNMVGKTIEELNVKTNSKTLLSYLCNNWIDEVFIATDSKKIPEEIYKGLSQAGISTSILTRNVEELSDRKQTINKLFGYTVIFSSISQRTPKEVFFKRLMDIIGGIVGCLITVLLTIIIGPIIYIKSPGPIFYKQERIGQNGRRFYMYKFRSMVTNADELKESLMSKNRIKDGMMFKIENDPRIIPGIGNFIRKTSLDEFPQFINVLFGDMSLVGTRPPTVDEWVKYKLEHRIRMAIKPGITGLWQTNGRSKITDFDKVIEYDTKYINEWSLGLDIEILLKTIYILLFVNRDNEAM